MTLSSLIPLTLTDQGDFFIAPREDTRGAFCTWYNDLMHHLYHTEAFVLSSYPHGETGVVFSLLTKEYGLLRATAQGLRTPQSKLRPTLQLFSQARTTLVHGKAGWRITTAQPLANVFYLFLEQPRVQEMFARVFSLIRRLVAGEEDASKLFSICEAAVSFCRNQKPDEDTLRWVEVLLVVRILHELGYVGNLPKEISVDHDVWSGEHLAQVSTHHKRLIEAINQAIEESQL